VRLIILKFYTMKDYDVAVDDIDTLHVKRIIYSEL
jgi:hypothetical protein